MTRQLLAAAIGMALAVLGATAEEFVLKDGTKILGKMVRIKGDSIEIETLYGKIKVSRGDILRIEFPQNQPKPAEEAALQTEPTPVDHSLEGTVYVNRTGGFTLTVPEGWRIEESLREENPAVIAALVSGEGNLVRLFLVVQEKFPASLEAYLEVVEHTWRSEMPHYEKLNESRRTINGREALVVEFRSIPEEKPRIPLRFLVVMLEDRGLITRITAWCIEPIFESARGEFEPMLFSYRNVFQEEALPE